MTTPRPYSFRIPAEGQVAPHFGGTRTFWKELVRSNGKPARVRSFTRVEGDAKRGLRFIEYASALKYMKGLNK